MKKLLLMLAIVMFVGSSICTASMNIDLSRDKQSTILERNDFQKIQLHFDFSQIKVRNVQTDKGVFSELSIPNYYHIGQVGTPQLPAAKELIEIPFGAEVFISAKNYSVKEYDLKSFGINEQIIPQQPSISKSTDPATVEFEYNEQIYQSNNFLGENIVSIEVLGILRGVRLARVVVSPVHYNPQKNKIKVYNNIDVNIDLSNSDEQETYARKAATYSPYFEPVYRKILNNRSLRDYPNHPDLTTYPIKYLIVSDPMYENALQDLIEWKSKKGFTVIEAYTDDIGSSYNDIQTYIHDQYDAGTPADPAPSFVLLVGDTPQIPAISGSSSNKDTDLYYCSVDGDQFPEMYYGRFSGTEESHIETQVEKTLYYEKYQFTDPSFLDAVTLIAGSDYSHNPTHGQPTVLYGTENYYNSAHGFTDVNLYLTDPYTGCYDTVDDGVNIINYTAHGSQTSWSDPSLTQSMVNNFENTGMYPLAIGNCCLSGDFGYGECFGETWARATDNTTGDPTGSIGYIASAPSSYWHEDVYWSVGAFPDVGNGVTPTYDETTWGVYDGPFVTDYVTQDALVFLGNMAVTEAHAQGFPQHVSSPLYYWQAYNLLGDPSLVVYQTQGDINSVSYNSLLPIGSTSFTVNAEPGSYVGISMNGVLHGAALVDGSGSVNVPIDPFFTAGTADIIVTKPQFQPYMSTVVVATPAVVEIDPASIPINTTTDVTISVYEDDGTTPIEDVNIEIDGPGIYGTTSGATNSSGQATLNIGCEYGGPNILNAIGWRTGDNYNLFSENIGVTGGLDLTNPNIWLTTDFGLQDTFGLNLPGTVHFDQDESDCTFAIQVSDPDTSIYSTDNTITYTPVALADIEAGIMKSGYNMYTENFTTIEVFGTVSGVVTDSDNGTPVTDALVRFYNQDGDPSGDPLFSATTNSSGEYYINDPYPVDYYDIYIEKWGYNPYQEFDFFLGYDENIHDISIEPVANGLVTGKLVDNFSILDEGTLTYYRSDNGEQFASVEISDDSYSVTLPYFTYEIYVSSPGHVPYSGTLSIEGDRQLDYNLGNAALFSDFETDNGGFSSNDPNGWQWGEPTAGGINAYSGTNVWATVLDGYYGTDEADWQLLSSSFNVPSSATLYFYHYYDFEGSSTHYDGGNVNITTDGGMSYDLITPQSGYDGTISGLDEQGFGGSITDWEQVQFDLSDYSGETASIMWHFGSDYSVHDYYGWYIDNVLVGDPDASYQIDVNDTGSEPQVKKLALKQNYPNPAPGATTISFALPQGTKGAELRIYNVLGQLVKKYTPEVKSAGRFSFNWDGTDMNNNKVSNGIYFYRLSTEEQNITKKMILVK